MAGKKKGKWKVVLVVLAVILLAALGFYAGKKGLLPLPGIGGEKGGRTTQSRESKKSEKRLKDLISIEDMKIRETKYGSLELTATGSLPDFSVYFEEYQEEAAKGADAAEFEKRLLARTAEALKEEMAGGKEASGGAEAGGREETGASSVAYVTREISVDLFAIDDSRGKDGWKEKELVELARQAAFDKELEEFALSIMGDYLSRTTDWEAEKAIWDEDAAGGNGAGTAGGTGAKAADENGAGTAGGQSAKAAGQKEVQTP